MWMEGFSHSPDGKESNRNAGDPGLIPGLGRSLGKGTGYPLQSSWAFPVAQVVKNLPATQETWIRSLGWEHPLEEGMATHSSILAWRIPTDRVAWQATVHGIAENWTWLSTAQGILFCKAKGRALSLATGLVTRTWHCHHHGRTSTSGWEPKLFFKPLPSEATQDHTWALCFF